MSLRLIYGRAGCGKSHFCLNDIKNRLEYDAVSTPLVLLVPEQYSLQAERNLIKTVGSGGIMQAEVQSFRRTAYRVFNEVGGFTGKHINSAGKSMLILKIIDKYKKDLKVFSKAAGQQGFAGTISETIAEFKRYGISPEVILKASKDTDEDKGLLKQKLTELGIIYALYEDSIRDKYLDADDDLTRLAAKIGKSRRFNGAEIWIDEFSGFTPQEYLVIMELAKIACRVNICLCTDCIDEGEAIDGCELFSPVRKTAVKLIELAEANGITVDQHVKIDSSSLNLTRFKDSEEIQYLERNFFSFPYKPCDKSTRNISIFMASNIYSEVEEAAREIIRLCRDCGLRYRDIAVVTGNMDEYEKLVRVIFSQYEIPYFIDQKISITTHPLIVLILSMLEIFIDNWSYESVFRYLKTGLTGIEQENIDLLENYVLACGIRGNRWTHEEDWILRPEASFDDNEIAAHEQEVLDKVNTVRREVTAPLAAFREKVRKDRKVRDICTALYEFLCDIGVPERMEDRIEAFRKSGQLGLANENSQVWNIVMDALDQVVKIMGDENAGIERFLEIMAAGLEEYRIGLIPPALDQVMVGNIERSKSHEISALFILGVNDGVFPKSPGVEGILSDKDREDLLSRRIELAQGTVTRTFEEQYLIYSAITTASRYLRLSYAIADHEGKTLRPSIVIPRLKKIFPQINQYSNISSSSGSDRLDLIAAPYPALNELIAAMRRKTEGFKIESLWQDVYRWYMGNDFWKDKCENAMSGLYYENQARLMKPQKIKELYGTPILTSVSRIENYASCPFAYYIKYGLKAKERRIFKLSPPDIGTFMHNVIDRFSKMIKEMGISWRLLEKEWCYKEISTIVDSMLTGTAGMILSSSKRYRYLSSRLKRTLTRAVLTIAEHIKRGGFEPLWYEAAFGTGGKLPPIKIELPTGDIVNLTGRIDRVDTMETEEGTYLRIVDYKSGSKAFKLSDVYYGLEIQLVTYLDAVLGIGKSDAKNREDMEKLLPGGILYFKIDDPVIKCKGDISEEEVEKAVMKELKMRGLLLADVKVIKEMDRQMEGDSLIIPARINKGDVLGRSSAATMEQFDMLRIYVKKLLVKLSQEMINGNILIRPYRKKKMTPCMYCSYSSVCHFDPGIKDNNYDILRDMKDEEVWKAIDSQV